MIYKCRILSSENSTNIESMAFGQRFVEAFENAPIAEIARKLGKTYQGVKNYAEGRIPSPDVLIEISHSTGCSIHWLLTGEGQKKVQQAKSNGEYDSVPTSATPPLLRASIETGFEAIPTKVYELTANAVRLERPVAEGTAMLRSASLRNRTTAEVVSFEIASDDFVSDGYRPGRHLVCVPCSLEEAQDGDEIIVEWKGRYYIRLFREHPGAVCLEHLLGLSPPIYAIPKDVKLLYRVVG
jgi:phage repressor protein C with HTH and peptisase S24 domain